MSSSVSTKRYRQLDDTLIPQRQDRDSPKQCTSIGKSSLYYTRRFVSTNKGLTLFPMRTQSSIRFLSVDGRLRSLSPRHQTSTCHSVNKTVFKALYGF